MIWPELKRQGHSELILEHGTPPCPYAICTKYYASRPIGI